MDYKTGQKNAKELTMNHEETRRGKAEEDLHGLQTTN